MNFDTTTWLIIGGVALLLVLLVALFLRGGRQKVIARPEHDKERPYEVSGDRPYVAADTTNKQELPAPTPTLTPEIAPAPAPGPVEVTPNVVPIAGEVVGIAMPPHATDAPDALTQLKGVGPKLAALLNDQGISRFDQLAALDDAGLDAVDAKLGTFAGRLRRDRVVEQACFLAAGDTASFEATFGKLGG